MPIAIAPHVCERAIHGGHFSVFLTVENAGKVVLRHLHAATDKAFKRALLFGSISKYFEGSNSFETVDSERLIEAIKLSPLQYCGDRKSVV